MAKHRHVLTLSVGVLTVFVAAMNAMRLACTPAVSAPRSRPIAGSAGRYISMAKGPMADSKPSTSAARRMGEFILRIPFDSLQDASAPQRWTPVLG